MASIKINSRVMRDKASTLTEISKSIKNLTDEMKTEMDRLRSSWEGSVAERTVEKFSSLSSTFEERYTTIENYAKFLNNVAEQWDRAQAEQMAAIENTKS